MLKKFSTVILFILIGLGAFSYWAIGNSFPRHSKLSTKILHSGVFGKIKDTYTVATYNIGHGQGIKDEPTDWRDEPYTIKTLKKLAKAIKKINADFIMLQEVDLDSNRTHHTNQAKFLAEEANYPHYACAVLWDENYLPFPFWPPETHIGRVKTANCILSKFELTNHERLIFDKPTENAFWYNWGYIDRSAQRVTVIIKDKNKNKNQKIKKLILVNTHLEAWSIPTRHKQIKSLINWIENTPDPIIVGGDFNAIPPEATRRKNFPDDPKDDYSGDKTIEYMREALSKNNNLTDSSKIILESKLFASKKYTFPAINPTRMLDYLFASKGVEIIKSTIVYKAKDASDHLPVLAVIKLD